MFYVGVSDTIGELLLDGLRAIYLGKDGYVAYCENTKNDRYVMSFETEEEALSWIEDKLID